MRLSDRLSAAAMHASARFSVRYDTDLRFAGTDLPKPRRRKLPTRYGKVPVHVYSDPAVPEPRGVYVHFHGGAWLMRYPQMDDFWCRYLVAEAGVAVVNVDFRAGPYVQYPVAQHECHDAAAAVAQEWGLPVVVGGFSSGGGLAASVCLQARDSGSFSPVLQVLGVPALDLDRDVSGETGMISPQLRGLVRRVYFPDPVTRGEAYASPVLAEDLTGLPRAVVMTAERDSLRADGDRYAGRLREAGVEVWHDVTPRTDHYFLTENPRRARETMAKVAEIVREAVDQ